MARVVFRIVAALAFAAAPLMPVAALASPLVTPCVGTLPPGTYNDVRVPAGTTCVLNSADVILKNVRVETSATLNATGTSVGGNIAGQDLSTVNVETTHVGGNVKLTTPTNYFFNGDDIALNVSISGAHAGTGTMFIASSQVGGNVWEVASQGIEQYLCGDVIGGSVVISGATSAAYLFWIAPCVGTPRNVIKGSLSVHNNNPSGYINIDSNDVGNNVMFDTNNTTSNITNNTIGGTLQCRGNTPSPVASGNSASQYVGQCKG